MFVVWELLVLCLFLKYVICETEVMNSKKISVGLRRYCFFVFAYENSQIPTYVKILAKDKRYVLPYESHFASADLIPCVKTI